MESEGCRIRNCILTDNEEVILELLNSGCNPNLEGGWPVRLAARYGATSVLRALIQFGANPHLLSESGASTLQLAVFSGKRWDQETWSFLLSSCDSSQLADGAAVAIIFKNITAYKKIMETGRCNTNIPTTLTGKTLEQLAKGYKLDYLLDSSTDINQRNNITPTSSPTVRRNRRETRSTMLLPHQPQRNLSPSVARFFNQTASQTSLTPTRSLIGNISPRSTSTTCSLRSDWPL